MKSGDLVVPTAAIVEEENAYVNPLHHIARFACTAAILLAGLLSVVPAAQAEFGIDEFDGAISAADESPYTQAGGHPYNATVAITFNRHDDPEVTAMGFPPGFGEISDADIKDIYVDLPPGLVGNPAGFPTCTIEQLINASYPDPNDVTIPTTCPIASQVGTTRIHYNVENLGLGGVLPTFQMVPGPGEVARFGFLVAATPILLSATLERGGEYRITIASEDIPSALRLWGAETTFWGTPANPGHDAQRCLQGFFGFLPPKFQCDGTPGTPIGPNSIEDPDPEPFITMPTACTPAGEGIIFNGRTDSWPEPGIFSEASFESHLPPGFPADPGTWGLPQGPTGCDIVPVQGNLSAQSTSHEVGTPSGLEVHVEVPNAGLANAQGLASSTLEKVEVTLPEGMMINPSQAVGLGVCSPAQYESTILSFFPTPGRGCPDEAKIGSVLVKSPLLDEELPGEVYVAEPIQNPFGSLLALYVVIKEPQRGVLIKLAAKVATDEQTGQITTTFDDLPQLPFSTFDFRFREGVRAPLVTPQACGAYETTARFWGHSAPDGTPRVSKSSFNITRGIGGGPCPTGSVPPFKPGLLAGTRNNSAGSYSPFDLRLFRTDSEQQFTNFSIKLPPGVVGKLAGVSFCSDAAIEAAKVKTGATEIATPSCPDSSYVGKTLVGAGAGPVQAYVPGRIYLAGPYNGSALSIAAITAAKVGPFDLGTVVIREALRVDPETAEVFIDPVGSDPLPHIIDGIPTKLKDIRAYVDRPEFVLNPTSCDRTSTASTVLGSGLDFASPRDDEPVTVSTSFQAASCASLAFKPSLRFNLLGATKRGGFPKLRAELRMRGREANIQRAEVTLPVSEFLANAHIGTVCTRVQFAKDQCPPRSVYGYARAFTPILDEPLKGPVYLRSSEHKLPDLVARLRSGKIEIHLVGRIDSPDGRIRSTFEAVPDAPVSKFVLTMQGGKKGLLENSTNLCARSHRAIVEFDGQNGKAHDFSPVVKPQCKASRKAAKRRNAR